MQPRQRSGSAKRRSGSVRPPSGSSLRLSSWLTTSASEGGWFAAGVMVGWCKSGHLGSTSARGSCWTAGWAGGSASFCTLANHALVDVPVI